MTVEGSQTYTIVGLLGISETPSFYQEIFTEVAAVVVEDILAWGGNERRMNWASKTSRIREQ